MYKMFFNVGSKCHSNNTLYFLWRPKLLNPVTEGCHLVQVIQDRLYPFLLAYSWLLALGGSRSAANEEDEAGGHRTGMPRLEDTELGRWGWRTCIIFPVRGKYRSLRCHGQNSLSLLEDCVILKFILKCNSVSFGLRIPSLFRLGLLWGIETVCGNTKCLKTVQDDSSCAAISSCKSRILWKHA